MSKVCAISGKSAMSGRHIRNTHSIGWKYRAPKKCRIFKVNIQTVTVPGENGGTQKIRVAARMLTSRAFLSVLSGEKKLSQVAKAPKK
ncbi:MAG: hypothetical protein H7145_17745 [Akkermansiaceae bacterium]|nr:hypothetical protein [Armatimonadota bacterium]